MRQFDVLKKEIIGNVPELVAIDNVENKTYVLHTQMDMKWADHNLALIIFISPGEAIEKRNGFHLKSERDDFVKNAGKLWKEIDEEKNRYRPH